LAAALSDIVAVERNHFLSHELTGIGRNRAVGSREAARFDARAALFMCGGSGSRRFAAG
jgi:hypothetical protein